MKRFLLVLAMVLLPMVALASPFIVSDPYGQTEVQPTVFEMLMDAATIPIDVLPSMVTNGGPIFKYDIVGLPMGNHSIQVRACIPDTGSIGGGRSCSAYVPFSFTLSPPSPAPKIPIGLRLQK